MDSMVTQHLDLYDWGTSNPIHSNLESTFIQPDGVRESIISGVSFVTAFVDPRVAGTFDTSATDARVLTQIQCGKGSYLEKVSQLCLPKQMNLVYYNRVYAMLLIKFPIVYKSIRKLQ